jgi:CspA family cold shock protein
VNGAGLLWGSVPAAAGTWPGQNVETEMQGTVKFFNAQKGYGFISREGGADVFVHFSNIEGSGYRSLEEGQTVEFEIGQGRKGDEALKVRPV